MIILPIFKCVSAFKDIPYLNISGNIYFKAESIHDLRCCFIFNLPLKYSSYHCSISIANQDDCEKNFR